MVKNNKTKFSGRSSTIKVKTAKGRRLSSTLWLQRQLNDPYVQEAKKRNYRSRASFKLLEMNDKFKFLKKGQVVVDLGAAPGGWSQVISQIIDPLNSSAKCVGIDLQPMDPIEGVDIICNDFTSDEGLQQLTELLNKRKVDVVLSDMAPKNTGHQATDHLRIINLAELALDFALNNLEKNGVYLAKVLQGGANQEIIQQLRKHFEAVRHIKPPASRQDSKELYVIALGFQNNYFKTNNN